MHWARYSDFLGTNLQQMKLLKNSHYASSFLCMCILCIRICICVCSYVYIFHMCLHQSDVVIWHLHTYVCMRLHMHMYIYLRNNFKGEFLNKKITFVLLYRFHTYSRPAWSIKKKLIPFVSFLQQQHQDSGCAWLRFGQYSKTLIFCLVSDILTPLFGRNF